MTLLEYFNRFDWREGFVLVNADTDKTIDPKKNPVLSWEVVRTDGPFKSIDDSMSFIKIFLKDPTLNAVQLEFPEEVEEDPGEVLY